ncbi:MAG: RNA-dependent DNA polymerase [bacterium]|nr:RNA-dependent DNA polymerase [bacterium]
MVRRSSLSIADVAAWDNLAAAFWSAASGKRGGCEVQSFAADLERRLSQISNELRSGSYVFSPLGEFEIRDPKRRRIHAPCFRDRVVHHALMQVAGPVLDRALVADVFACRVGKGPERAVCRLQQHSRRWPWLVGLDVRQFFASIRHDVLLSFLQRRFKNPDLLRFMEQVVCSHEAGPGRGLPIGALTSQHFANYYLSSLDRLLLERTAACGVVRYMDDVVVLARSKRELEGAVTAASEFVEQQLGLSFHDSRQVRRASVGVTFCGFRVTPGSIRLSRRRRRRYLRGRRDWERAYRVGCLHAEELQRGYSSVLAMTQFAGATAFRREDLRRRPEVEC